MHGLEFAGVRHGSSAQSFTPHEEITFGAGANETPLSTGAGGRGRGRGGARGARAGGRGAGGA